MRASRANPLLRLSSQLSAVINRVRRAFGPISMADMARRPEVIQAEARISAMAWQVAQGERDLGAWRRALEEYEGVWMELLANGCRAGENRHAA